MYAMTVTLAILATSNAQNDNLWTVKPLPSGNETEYAVARAASKKYAARFFSLKEAEEDAKRRNGAEKCARVGQTDCDCDCRCLKCYMTCDCKRKGKKCDGNCTCPQTKTSSRGKTGYWFTKYDRHWIAFYDGCSGLNLTEAQEEARRRNARVRFGILPCGVGHCNCGCEEGLPCTCPRNLSLQPGLHTVNYPGGIQKKVQVAPAPADRKTSNAPRRTQDRPAPQPVYVQPTPVQPYCPT